MQLILIEKQGLIRCNLPDKCSGRYWVKHTKPDGTLEDGLCVEGLTDDWILKSNRHAQLLGSDKEPLKERKITASHFYSVRFTDTPDETLLIYARPDTEDRRTYKKFLYPKSGTITIGRSEDNNLHFANDFASGYHATLSIQGTELTLTDAGSQNGTFVNDERVTAPRRLVPGDCVEIIDLTLVVSQGFFAVNNPDGLLSLDTAIEPLAVQKPHLHEDEDDEIEESSAEQLFFRSPRMQRAITEPKIKIDEPPSEEKPDDTPIIMMIGPAMTMGLGSLMMAMFAIMQVQPDASGHRNYMSALPMIVMAVMMMIGMIVFPILSRNHDKKKRLANEVKRKDKYRAYLKKTAEDIEREKQTQSEILYENCVELQACVNRIRARERSLWERTEDHTDFLDVRVGIGDWPLAAEFQAPERGFTMDDDQLQDELFKIVDSPRVIHEVPVVVSLTKRFSMGIIGDRFDTVKFLKGLIFQLAALHAYDEVKFLFIYNKQESQEWDFVRWLPHVWSQDKTMRFVATNLEEVRQLGAYLEQVQQQSQDDTRPNPDATRYVVFAFDRDLASKCEALNNIFRSREYHNVSVLAVYDELRYLPKDCKVVLEVDPQYSKIYDRSVMTGDHMGFVPDQDLQDDARQLAVLLANTKLESATQVFALPTMLTFLEMYGVGQIEHLNVRTRWKESNPVRSLAAPIGLDAMGNLCDLDIHERAHGPHGLVAGMTGSGKSEFIMTYILSLAVNYHPDEVAFVLIDYKGGGMANAFAHLPHTVGIITNLDGASVNRSLASIQSELKRRQAIFNEASQATGVSNIDIYKYQSLYREGQVKEPLPHLVLISDEFAELKTQRPEFMEQLVSAARIGRSLGVHLILATQKPSGVVDDQIWANSKFKICLKVQDKADSMEMIKRPDAAELVETGRFYLQVGYNELFELGQSAWAGATYIPSDHVARDYDASVTLLDLQGRPIMRVEPPRTGKALAGKTKQLDEVTNYLIEIAQEDHIKPRPLWMPPLPERIYLDELYKRYHAVIPKTKPYQLDAVMGEFDDPATQTQGPVEFSLTTGGNLVLYGMTGGGKTHFLNTLIYSLIKAHGPEEVNFYLLDFGSETLTAFEPAPQVGDVLLSNDVEKTENIFKMLEKELARRKKLFVDFGGEYQSYIQNAPEKVPNIIVVINGFSAFTEMYDSAVDWLSRLTREGVKYGIYFILTASATNAVNYRLQQNFKQTICLQIADVTDYSTIFGRLQNISPAPTPGRGLYRAEDGVHEFQTALISEELADSPLDLRQHYLESFAAQEGQVAPPVPCLPETVTADQLGLTKAELSSGLIPVGMTKEGIKILRYDFSRAPAALVLAADDGWRSFMRGFAQMLEGCQAGSVGYIGAEKNATTAVMATEAGIALITVETLIKAGAAGKLPSAPTWLMIPGIATLYDRLDAEQQASFAQCLKRLADEKNTKFLFAENSISFAGLALALEINDLFLPNSNNGIWIGHGFTDQYQLKVSTSGYRKDSEGKFGYVLIDGTPILAKMLEPKEEADE